MAARTKVLATNGIRYWQLRARSYAGNATTSAALRRQRRRYPHRRLRGRQPRRADRGAGPRLADSHVLWTESFRCLPTDSE
ncbi:short-chain dehydrogenase/reductase family oxidoreductase domain protein [Mycobacterium xenopi 3993]|nr:short-chain dehydrogenase/reductase family oxidoreductase domain protein [Mycobacterium xenopi 3993]